MSDNSAGKLPEWLIRGAALPLSLRVACADTDFGADHHKRDPPSDIRDRLPLLGHSESYAQLGA